MDTNQGGDGSNWLGKHLRMGTESRGRCALGIRSSQKKLQNALISRALYKLEALDDIDMAVDYEFVNYQYFTFKNIESQIKDLLARNSIPETVEPILGNVV